MKLTPRLTLIFILCAAALLSVVGMLAYTSGRNSLRSATISELSATAIEKQATLNQWVEEKQTDIAALAASPTIIEETSALIAAPANSPEASAVRDRLIAEIQPRVLSGEFLVVMLIDPRTGEVIAATDPSEEGKFKEDRPFFLNGKTGPYIQNLYYSVALQSVAMTASAPLKGSGGQLLGVLAGRIDLDEMNRIITRRSGLRQTDDAFLVNTSNLFVTQPYLVTDPAVLQLGVHTEAVNRCLKQTSGTIEAEDYRGVPAIISYRWLPQRELCLIVKIDQVEAYAPAREFGRTVAGISILALLVAAGLAFTLSRSLTRPILALQSGAARFRQGELDMRLPDTSRDELGALAHEFNQMAASISEKDNQLRTYSFELEKRVEERTSELQQSEERFRLATEASPNAMIMAGQDGKVSFVNQAAVALFGYTEDELIRSPLEALIPERFRTSHPAFRESFFGDAYPRPMGKGRDLYALRKDGTEVPVEIGLSPVETREGLFALATITDISERKRAQEKLQESEARYRHALDAMLEGCQIIGFDWRYRYLNDIAEKQNRRPNEELLGKKYMDMWPGIESTEVFSVIRQCMEERRPQSMENKFVFPDGAHGWFELKIYPVPEGIVILSVDITERKQAEDVLRKSEERFSKAFRASPAGVTITSLAEDKFLDANESFLNMFEYRREEVIGHTSVELNMLSPEERAKPIQRLREQGHVQNFELQMRTHSGRTLYVLFSTEQIELNGMACALATIVDITDRKQAQEAILKLNEELEERVILRTHQLEAANKELEAFSYSVSHDLRAPLRSIDGFSKILLEDYGEQLAPEGRQHLDRVRSSAQRMAELIDDLLKLARVTRAPMQPQLIDLSEIAEGVARALKEQEPDRNLTVSITSGLTVNGDLALLKIALENLLSNAWKFTSKKEQALIEFGSQQKDGERTFFIRDNGVGFDMAYVNKLFGVFQRLHAMSEFPGTGVGLATVQRIIKIHGGRIWAEGQEGKGATFYFTL